MLNVVNKIKEHQKSRKHMSNEFMLNKIHIHTIMDSQENDGILHKRSDGTEHCVYKINENQKGTKHMSNEFI